MFRLARRMAVAVAALLIVLPIAAARADAFVYWTVFGTAGNGLVSRANTDGTSPNYTFLTHLFGAQAMAIDGTYIYWANGPQGIGRATLDGKTVDSNFIVAAFTATALAVDSTHGFIYYTNARTGSIGRASLSGGTAGLNNALVDTLGAPTGVAVDSVNGALYWTLNPGAGQGVIGRANLDGTSPNRGFIHSLAGAQGITLDSQYIYWGNGPSQIGRVNLDGSNLKPGFILGARINTPSGAAPGTSVGLAVDESYVYWVDNYDDSIGRAPIGGGTNFTNLFIRSFGNPTGLAVDGLSNPSPGPLPPPPPMEIDPLQAGVRLLALPQGIERSLLAKLVAAGRALDGGDLDGACDSLSAYVHQVTAQSGKKIDVAPAAGLVADATAASRSLGCGSGESGRHPSGR
jgi:hypothetical protein